MKTLGMPFTAIMMLMLAMVSAAVADVETSTIESDMRAAEAARSPRWYPSTGNNIEVSVGPTQAETFVVPRWHPNMGISQETWLIYMADYVAARCPQPSRFKDHSAQPSAPRRQLIVPLSPLPPTLGIKIFTF